MVRPAAGSPGRVTVSTVLDDRALWGARTFLRQVFAGILPHRFQGTVSNRKS